MDMPAKMVVVKDRDKKILTPWRGEVNWSKKFMFRHFKFKGCSENRKYGAFLKKIVCATYYDLPRLLLYVMMQFVLES